MKTKKLALSCMFVAVAAISSNAQQLPNNNFEEAWAPCKPWTNGNTTTIGENPNSWTISNVAGLKLGLSWSGTTQVGVKSTAGHNGSASAVELYNAQNEYAKSQIVPGYLTLGTTWATSTGTGNNKDGGTWGGINFTYCPDAVSFWYKDTRADATEQSTVVAYLWNGTFEQANVPCNNVLWGNPATVNMQNRDRCVLDKMNEPGLKGGAVTKKGTLIAKIDQYLTGNVSAWTEQVVDFNYVDQNAAPQMFNIIFSAGNYWSTTPKNNNKLWVDDVTLLYYSRLSDLKVNGATVAGFDSKTFEYTFFEKVPALGSVVATKMGNAPKTVSTELAANGSDILVTVANQAGANDFDGKSTHTYTLSYLNDVLTGATSVFNVSPNGSLIKDYQAMDQNLYLKKDNKGNYSVILPNEKNYGTIRIDNIVSADGKNINKTTVNNVQVSNGRTATVAISGKATGNTYLYTYSITVDGTTQIITFTNDTKLSGVEAVESLNEKVVANAGAVEVCGVNGNVSVYTVDGRLVKSVLVNGEATIELANGLYIVRTPNAATKVLVK